MKTITKNIPAFPLEGVASTFYNQNPLEQQSGMTLLDYFANSAMQAIYNRKAKDIPMTTYESIAKDSYCMAIEMLKQREIILNYEK